MTGFPPAPYGRTNKTVKKPPEPKPCPRCYQAMLFRDGRWLCPKHGWSPSK